MHTKAKRSKRDGAQHLGSLCGGDIGEIARTVHQATLAGHVVVWSDVNADVRIERAERSPEVDPRYLAGTYGLGSQISDIENDLMALRTECVSASILF